MFGARKPEAGPPGGDQLSSSPSWRYARPRVVTTRLFRAGAAFQAAAGFFDERVSTDAARNRASSFVRRACASAPRSRCFARVSARPPKARVSSRVAARASFPSLTAARAFFHFPTATWSRSTDYISRLLHEDEHPRSASAAPLGHGDSELPRSMSAVDLVRPLATTANRPFPGETRTRRRSVSVKEYAHRRDSRLTRLDSRCAHREPRTTPHSLTNHERLLT